MRASAEARVYVSYCVHYNLPVRCGFEKREFLCHINATTSCVSFVVVVALRKAGIHGKTMELKSNRSYDQL